MGDNGEVSNPYAPPSERPRPEPEDAPDTGSQTTPRAPHGPATAAHDPAEPSSAPTGRPTAPTGRTTVPTEQVTVPTQQVEVPTDQRAVFPDRRPAPGAEPAAPAAVPPRDIDPEQLRLTGAAVRHFGVFLLAAVLAGTFPLPWRAASILFVAGAVVVGIRALRLVRRSGMRGSLVPLLAVGLAFTAMLGIGTVGSFLFWSAETGRQECLSDALTVSATSACEQQYQEDLSQWQRDMERSAGLSTGS